MSVLNTPYPRPSTFHFLKVIGGISLTVIFILIVFQPFGTASFHHPYKYLLLSGYGIVIFVSGGLFYIFSSYLLGDKILDKWTVTYEILILFATISVSQAACFLYWALLFGKGFDIQKFIYFFEIASSVSVVPVSGYLIYIYQKYKDVNYLNLKPEDQNKNHNNQNQNADPILLHLKGSGKNENYFLEPDNLILISSEDNYVILHIIENSKAVKKMVRITMNEIEKQLNHNFIRVHRSFIINLNRISGFYGNINNSKLVMEGIKNHIPVSRTFADKIKSIVEKKTKTVIRN
ncbi:MAG: LytTR family transcriptional regulator [Saprospiraceae bacterium]|nr:LytTR family transcriptional regulator [Saprospiraceae bacterium]